MAIETNLNNEIASTKKTRQPSSRKKSAKIDKFFEKPIEEIVAQQSMAVEIPEQFEPVTDEPVIFLDEKKPIFSFLNKKVIFWIFLSLLIITLAGISGYFYYQYKKAIAVDAGKNEISSYISKIGKFMVLPEGEEPTMATVADRERLSSQSFFAKAENGDKVLFFSKSQKAILYRPSQNMIIEATAMAGGISSGTVPNSEVVNAVKPVAPVEEVKPAEEQVKTQSVVEDVKSQEAVIENAKVVVNNGTSQKGLAKTVAEKIATISGVEIVSTGNTVGNFNKTVVVDFGGKNAKIAEEIAKELGGEVGNLPSSELNPEADILVIAGK